MQKFRKYLVYEYVPIMEKTFKSDTRESCIAQRSIYVILNGNEETNSYINQVRNVLRSLFSDRICKCILIKVEISDLLFCLTFLEALLKARNISRS